MKIRIVISSIVSIIIDLGIICFIGFAVAGFYDSIQKTCQVTGCSPLIIDNVTTGVNINLYLEELDNGQLYPMTTTYSTETITTCSNVPNTMQCYYYSYKHTIQAIRSAEYGYFLFT